MLGVISSDDSVGCRPVDCCLIPVGLQIFEGAVFCRRFSFPCPEDSDEHSTGHRCVGLKGGLRSAGKQTVVVNVFHIGAEPVTALYIGEGHSGIAAYIRSVCLHCAAVEGNNIHTGSQMI